IAAGGSWLSVTPASGTTPSNVSVSVNPAGLAAGTYNGTVTLSASGATPKVVNVTLVVSSGATISATPSTLSFTYRVGDTSPAAQSLAIGGSAGLAFTVAPNAGASWLIGAANGTSPANTAVSVNP